MSELVDEVVVLYVDDDEDFTELTATFLEREHDRFRVETATSVAEGLDRVADTEFDCVVSDYDMPERDGLNFLEALREDAPDLPFILFTGKGSEEVASDAISAGVTEYLQKEHGTSQYTVLANRIENAVEQYRSQRALETSEQRLSLFIEQSPLGVLEYDSDFQIVGLNERGEEILGYTEAELRGHSWELIVADDSYDNVDAVTDQLAVAEGGYHSIDENVRKDGEHIRCEWHNRTITNDDGAVVGIISLFQDVTERTRREDELERTNALLSTLIRSLPVGVLAENSDRTVLAINERLVELFDVSEPSTELIGADCRELAQMASELVVDSEGFVERVDELIAGTESVHNETVALTNGRTLNRSYEPIELPEGTGHLWMYRDTTEQRKREQQLQRQNERLSEFASVVSHDLRNPLNVAAGNVELARQDHESDRLATAARALNRIDDLIEDLLTLARKGDNVGELEPVSLGPLVSDCWETIETADAELQTDVTATVIADRSRLQQLVENLVRNSIEHGGDGVAVTVGELPDGFYVEDDGVGIPAERRDTIFEAGRTTSRTGTGFGLAIVKQVAEAHGWDVSVADSDAGGARFEITGVTFADVDD
ncbi:receiver/sensor box histidine kinase (plasmid) [Haloferax gibbonsii]|uniref:histidine kinase n=1 Tax=Haloferax gibbonsii TaxID=35746 RepID=A0A871BKQ5_HALGI|nr:PAS domain S-box protein [Haloferax gibbonsii]QOS13379.1 receiver/sensor box histidine kinase [Haloferax gibbonsii]